MNDSTLDPRQLRKLLTSYQQPAVLRSALEILVSAAPLGAVWVGAWFAVSAGLWWLALLLTLPAAAFLVRLFAIQHDCGHGSFFKTGYLNDWTGRIIGVVTLTPYDCWRREHAIHHATSGDLDRRGPGAVYTLTVEEYAALQPIRRLAYRFYRHPVVLFFLGPIYVFLLQQRFPIGLMREGWRPWISAMGTNAAAAILIGVAVWLGGWGPLLLIHVPTIVIAASIGVWLFFVQHQFEQTHWARHDDWDATESALIGSSHYELPAPLPWITANIGVHHVHHVASRIPFYRLPEVLKRHPELRRVGRITLMQSLRCAGLALWDEAGRRLISFREYRAFEQGQASAP